MFYKTLELAESQSYRHVYATTLKTEP